jgi:hypothetical protein
MRAGNGTAVGSMTEMTCGECGIEFHVPSWWQECKLADGTRWYCPNGHCRVYNDTTVMKLKRELSVAERRRQETQSRLEEERQFREATERRLRAARGQQTKLRKRIAAGCCPCCQRTFQNLARHMAGQHPEYVGVES